MIRFVDAFAGVGGLRYAFSLGIKEAGEQSSCVSAIEFDNNSRDTYALNFGNIPEFNDITKICDMSAIPDHDVLLGGFPCQVFSRNGKFYNKNDRTLGDDDRKNLVTYLFKILRVKKPFAFLFENVKELLTIKNMDGSSFFQTICDAVSSLGYHMKHSVLDAKDFGLPQQRKRVYMVGFSSITHCDNFSFPEGYDSGLFERCECKLPVCVGDILQKDVDDSYLLENLWRSRQNLLLKNQDIRGKYLHLYGGNKRVASRLEALKLAYASGTWRYEQSIDKPTESILPVAIIYGDTPSGLPRQQDKLYSIWGVSPTIATFSTPPFNVYGNWRILTPRECARLQGLPDHFLLPENDILAYHQVGNGIAVNVVKAIASQMAKMMRMT